MVRGERSEACEAQRWRIDRLHAWSEPARRRARCGSWHGGQWTTYYERGE